jgi:hypothetical protein
MSKKMICLFSLLALTACGGNQENVASVNYKPIAVNYTSSTVRNAAVTGLPAIVGSVGTQWAKYGFLSQAEVASAQLGTPYPIFVLNNPGKSNQAVSVMDEWDFPIMVNNAYRCMLTVAKMNDQWEAVGIGAAGFAASLQATEKSHPLLDIKNRGIVKSYGFSSSPYDILATNLSEMQPSFLLLPPGAELVKNLPQYSTWLNTDPVPVLSFEEIFLIFSKI